MEPRRLFGRRFERAELVGQGGAGHVYRALDHASGQIVALKLLASEDPGGAQRFEQEARVLAGLQHPHVVRYVGHGITDEGEPFLAMEWLEGESLTRRLARGALELSESVAIALGVAKALAVAHAGGVVHRDIKPSNLFLVHGDPADVRVLDFGLVHVVGTSQIITREGALAGTPGYMAPEQARGEDEAVDARADVFSLGAVLFECLTGRRAFEGIHVMALLAQLILAEVPRVREIEPSVPAALDELVARMLAKDPAARPASGAEVARALEALGDVVPVSLRAASPPPSITADERRLLAVAAITRDRSGDPALALARVRSIAGLRGARVDELASGAVLVTLAGQGSATDQAAAAARCALRLRAALPGASMALAMGHGEATGRLPIGPVVERAAGLIAAARESAECGARALESGVPASATRTKARTMASAVPPFRSGVLIDEVTRALLDERFDVRAEAPGLVLAAEREIDQAARTLLGRPSPYVGRERELRMLTELVEGTFEGERAAQAVVIAAPAGMGKTRLRHELVKGLREARPEVAIGIGRADAMSAGSAFVVLGSAVRNAVGIAADEPPEAARARLLERIAPYVPAAERGRVAAFLGELTGVPFPDEGDPALAAARKNGARMADEVARAFVDFLRGVCADHPVLLVLEDLHWGDAASVRLLDQALRELADRPFVVLALGRPEMYEVFPGLWSKREAQSVRLGALVRRAAEELVTRSLGPDLPAADVARIVSQAAGNVFYLEELIRAVAEGRGDRLPETVLGMVEARLEALPPGARRLLRAASVFGETFTKSGVLTLLGEGERAEASREWLPLLVDRELLVRRVDPRGSGEEEYTFRHALLREGSYAMLTARDRALGHRLAASFLRGEGRAGAEARAALIGEHLSRAEDWDEAAAAFDQAGDEAARLYANVEARLHYGRALDALGRLAGSVDERRRRVDAMIKKVAVSYGDDPDPNLALLAEAEAIALALPDAARPPSDDYRRVARVHFWMGRCHWYRNAYPEAIGYYRRTLAAAQELGDDELAALPAGTIGRVMTAQGHFGRAVPLVERSLAALERSGNWAEWVVNAGFLGVAGSLRGGGEGAVAQGERALSRAREMNSLTSVSGASTILAVIHIFSGRPEPAIELLRGGAKGAEQAGDRVYAYLACGFAAWAESRLGHHEESIQNTARSKAISAELGRRLVFADWFDAFAVEAAQRAGRAGEAITEAARAAPAFEAAGSIFAAGIARRAWGLALAAQEDAPLDEAIGHLSESLRLLSLGEAHVEAARTRIGLARLHRRRGDAASAAAEIEAAARVLEPIGAAGEIEAALAGPG